MAWKSSRKNDLPVFSMIALMYWLYYVLPLFWEPHTILEIYSPVRRELSADGIAKAMLMAVPGGSGLWVGIQALRGKGVGPGPPSMKLEPSRPPRIRPVVVHG